jgi:uncharacterized protein YoxC
MKLKFSKNSILSVVFAIVLIVFALYLIKSLDKTGREGAEIKKTASFGQGTVGTAVKSTGILSKRS